MKDISTNRNAETHHRVIIIGAGPGGLQLGYCLDRAGIDYLILERGTDAGMFFEKFPVHRKLLSINKPNTGFDDVEKNFRWDWNSLFSPEFKLRMAQYDEAFFPQADSYVQYLRDYCHGLKLQVEFNANVDSIDREGAIFKLRTDSGRDFSCELLVVATGLWLPFTPDIPGVELAEQYGSHDRSVAACKNKQILIIGKGNSAFETGEEFLPHAARIHLISPAHFRMAIQTHFVGHLRLVNSQLWETFLLKQQNAVLNGTIRKIEKANDKFTVTVAYTENGYEETFAYDRVILCTGFRVDLNPFAPRVRPDLTHADKLPVLTARWESRNVPGLFFCGTLMQSNDYKKSASAFVHGMRYNAVTLSRFIEERLSVRAYPTSQVPATSEALFEAIYARLRRASSLWHMHNFLCDAYVYRKEQRCFAKMEDLPGPLLMEEGTLSRASRVEFRFTFENPTDPVEREKFTPIGLLHPVLSLYLHGELVQECHMYEDVSAEWERSDYFLSGFQSALTDYVQRLAA